MLAYQMIYTACGKDKSGAFSVWAKSDNVTKTECDEIVKLMSYKKAPNTPYEPTDEEIETLFPKKYAYFILSSGRRCVAQSSYIGKVYSDQDNRNGNFIIHAFIFDELQGFNPYCIFEHGAFKSNLSYKEWHDDPVPMSLPPIDMNSQNIASEAAVKKLILGGYKQEIASLLQAVINAQGASEKITFNDTEENIKLLYAIMGTLLPASYFADATFCTQYSPQLDYTLTTTGMPPIKIRNIFASMVGSAFNYQEELAAGHIVFNFKEKICSNVTMGRYITDIIQTVEIFGLFNALKKVEAVGSIMATAQCPVDTAIAIYYLTQKNLNWFSGAAEYSSALEIALKCHYITEKDIVDYLYEDIVLTGKWGRGREILSLIKFSYDFSEANTKASIIDRYFSELSLYGVNTASAPQSVLAQIKDNAPFPWGDYSLTVVRNSKWKSYIDSMDASNELYFVLDAAVTALSMSIGEAERKTAYRLMYKIIQKAVAHRSFEEVQLYMSCVNRLGGKLTIRLVESALRDLLNCPNNDEKTMDLILRIICSLENEQDKIRLLTAFVIGNMQNVDFMDLYIHYSEQYKNLFERLENLNKTDAGFGDFLFRKEVYVFKKTTEITFRILEDYYKKVYKQHHDNGILLEKIKQYLAAQSGKSKIAEGIKLYAMVSELDDDFEDVLDIIEYISKDIFSLPMEELLNYVAMYNRELTKMNARLSGARRSVSEKNEIVNLILLMRGEYGTNYSDQALAQNTIYSSLSRAQLAEFTDKYFGEALKYYFAQKKKKITTSSLLLLAIFERPLTSPNAKDSIIKSLEELGDKEYYNIMADIMACAFNESNRFAKALKAFVVYYVNAMKRGDYKKLFKKVVDIMPQKDVPAVQKYIDKYLESHMSFFEMLFGKKK